ncbi:MAG TPA: glycosyltransferase family 4 protein [Planctomycetota bacterium]|nr:glycosyltransferase family 4 protein [Planctomycetota bacterium]
MKVLVANDLYGRSSAAGVAVRLAEGVAARGVETTFLATVQKQDQARRFRENGVDVRLEYTPPYDGRWRAWRSLDNPAGVAAMKSAVAEVRPDVVHVHNLHIHLSYAALAAARAGGARTILHVHDIMPVCHQKMFCHLDERLQPGDPVVYRNGPVKCALCVRGRYNPLRNATIRRVLARDVDRLVAVSDEMGAALAQNGIGPCTTIWNGMEFGDEPPAAVVEALRERLGLRGRRVVFYGGRLDRLKGGLELVRALEIVRRDVPGTVLLTVGEALPGFYGEMQALARNLGMADALVSAGWLHGDELAAAYRLADVVATPSLCFESFGLVNLEAMAARRPVVASFWGGPSDVVVDGVTGFLVNPLHVATLAARLLAILLDPQLAARLGEAGRTRAEAVFGLSAQVERTLRLYAELGSARGAAA